MIQADVVVKHEMNIYPSDGLVSRNIDQYSISAPSLGSRLRPPAHTPARSCISVSNYR